MATREERRAMAAANAAIADRNRKTPYRNAGATFSVNSCKCISCTGNANGILSVPIIIEGRTTKVQYVHEDCWFEHVDPVSVAWNLNGYPNKVRCAYRVRIDVEGVVNGEQHGSIIAARNNYPWYCTDDNQYTSPVYLNDKGMWQRLETISKFFPHASVYVEAYGYERDTETGAAYGFFPLDSKTFTWRTRDERGRFIKKDGERKAIILRWIDEVTAERKRYRNYYPDGTHK